MKCASKCGAKASTRSSRHGWANRSQNILLVPRSRAEVRATLDLLAPEVRAQISRGWLALLEKSSPQDPWVHGFHVVNDSGLVVGLGGFKGPPHEGAAEVAYAIEPGQQGKGHATF